MRVSIDGEQFSILERPGNPGVYDFTWLTGPNPEHGFTIGTSDRRPVPVERLKEAAADFLAGIDAETGS